MLAVGDDDQSIYSFRGARVGNMADFVREFHVRQWYVLGDVYERVGDATAARRWVGAVAEYDDDYADVSSRLRGLGR